MATAFDSWKGYAEGDGPSAGSPQAPIPNDTGCNLHGLFADRYQIQHAIGRGGMAEVYLAFDEKLGRLVALKVLLPTGDPTSTTLATRLLREASVLAGLQHPNIVTLFDMGEAEGTPYIAMEYVRGQTLRALLADPSISFSTRLTWLRQMAEALATAHGQGIIHRDIKPENILLSADTGLIKVVDFGISKALSGDNSGCLTGKGMVVGTPLYMAPEQIGEVSVDARVDQFALGLLGIELLSGIHPLLRRSLGGAPISLPSMPPAIGAVLARARAHHPTDRFPTMRAFLEALDEAVAASKVGTPPAKGAPADRRGRLRSLSFLGVSTAILLAACAFLHRTGALAGSTNTAMGVAVDHAPRSPSESLAQGESLPSERLEAPERVFLSRDVQAAFQRGLQLWRDASTDAAREQFELAARLDPSLATAHLHYVMVSELVEPSVRDHLRQAIALRGTLTKSEARLLDALIPAVLDANQQDETLDRLARLANTSPHDGDLQMVLALHLVHAHRLPSALGLARPWAIQSANALPHFVAARCLAEMDDADGLHQQLASCLDRAPSSGDCLEMSIRLALNDGQCTEAEALSRRFIAASPQASLPYLFLAEALAGEGRAPDEVRAPLEQRWFRDGDAVRSLHRCRDEGLVEILRGDFRRADEALESCTKAEVTQVDSYAQGIPRWLRAEVAREVGDVSKAQRLAREFVAASAAWSPNEVYESRMEGWQLLRKAGAMSADEFDKLRTTWLSQPLSADHYYSRPGVRWFEAYACTAMTNEEARLALAELPAEKPLFPVHFREPHVDATLGEMFLRAGVHAEARAHLERSAKSCSVFSYLKIAQAQDQLGTLYETLGQPDEACASYKSILARWGPESGSRHARHASARWKALGCSSRSN